MNRIATDYEILQPIVFCHSFTAAMLLFSLFPTLPKPIPSFTCQLWPISYGWWVQEIELLISFWLTSLGRTSKLFTAFSGTTTEGLLLDRQDKQKYMMGHHFSWAASGLYGQNWRIMHIPTQGDPFQFDSDCCQMQHFSTMLAQIIKERRKNDHGFCCIPW